MHVIASFRKKAKQSKIIKLLCSGLLRHFQCLVMTVKKYRHCEYYFYRHCRCQRHAKRGTQSVRDLSKQSTINKKSNFIIIGLLRLTARNDKKMHVIASFRKKAWQSSIINFPKKFFKKNLI